MKSSKAEKRHHTIIEMLSSGRTIPVEEFCQTFHCSPSTVRNDLNYLSEQGQLVRIFGGAQGMSPSASASRAEAVPQGNILDNSRQIAAYVTEHLISPHSTIILDAGDITLEIGRLLARKNIPVSILTFSLPIINTLAGSPTVTLYSFGGFYDIQRKAFFDDYIQEHAHLLHADIYFMQANSVSPEAGFTIPCQDTPTTERALMKSSTNTIALCDSSNLCKSNSRIIADFTAINTMVTDSNAEPDYIRRLRNAGLNVLECV